MGLFGSPHSNWGNARESRIRAMWAAREKQTVLRGEEWQCGHCPSIHPYRCPCRLWYMCCMPREMQCWSDGITRRITLLLLQLGGREAELPMPFPTSSPQLLSNWEQITWASFWSRPASLCQNLGLPSWRC